MSGRIRVIGPERASVPFDPMPQGFAAFAPVGPDNLSAPSLPYVIARLPETTPLGIREVSAGEVVGLWDPAAKRWLSLSGRPGGSDWTDDPGPEEMPPIPPDVEAILARIVEAASARIAVTDWLADLPWIDGPVLPDGTDQPTGQPDWTDDPGEVRPWTDDPGEEAQPWTDDAGEEE